MEEKDILELEKRYWGLKGSSPTGKLDPDTLVPLISPPLPPMLAKGVFNAFDENRDNHIDFKVSLDENELGPVHCLFIGRI